MKYSMQTFYDWLAAAGCDAATIQWMQSNNFATPEAMYNAVADPQWLVQFYIWCGMQVSQAAYSLSSASLHQQVPWTFVESSCEAAIAKWQTQLPAKVIAVESAAVKKSFDAASYCDTHGATPDQLVLSCVCGWKRILCPPCFIDTGGIKDFLANHEYSCYQMNPNRDKLVTDAETRGHTRCDQCKLNLLEVGYTCACGVRGTWCGHCYAHGALKFADVGGKLKKHIAVCPAKGG